jgi:hypothetical protein
VLDQAPFLKDSKHFEQHGFDVIDMLLQIAVASPLFMYHVEEDGIDKYHEIISIRNSYRERIIFLQNPRYFGTNQS